MANLKELRLRIATVKNTRKITAAMSQIASARLRKAQNALMAARPYGERMQEVAQHLAAGIDPAERKAAHPLLEEREVERTLVIAMTADRGLCGGFNSNINRATARLLEQERRSKRQAVLVAVGRKAQAYFRHYGEDIAVATGVSPHTVRSRLARARDALAAALRAEPATPVMTATLADLDGWTRRLGAAL